MAGNKCSLTCNVKDSKGRVKVSALWENLFKFFKGDRRSTMIYYFLTKDNNFLMENGNDLEFDADGEVTISSLKRALEKDGELSDLSNAKTLDYLNRELKTGKYDYSEALNNVLKFNKQNQFNQKFMATLEPEQDGKYRIKVVERNPDAEYKLSEHVQNKILVEAIKTMLSEIKDPSTGKGLSIEFLNNPNYASYYSTNNVHMDADGLLAVASVLDGTNSAMDAAEVAGHFIVAAMQDNKLVKRLIDSLTPEVQTAIFKDSNSELNRDSFIVSESSAKEAAGILLGRQLLEPILKAQKTKTAAVGNAIPAAVKWLLNKIKTVAKKILGIYKPDYIREMIHEAKEAAAEAAQGFINDPYEGINVTEALNSQDVYVGRSVEKKLSDDVKRNVEVYRETLEGLKDIVAKLRTSVRRTESPTNREIFKKLKELSSKVQTNYSLQSSQMTIDVFAKNASIEGMTVILEGITEILNTDIRALLNEIQPSDRVQSYAKMSSNVRNMTTVNTTVKGIAEMYLALSNKLDTLAVDTEVQFLDSDSNQVVTTLKDAIEKLGDILEGSDEVYEGLNEQSQTSKGLQRVMELKRRQIFIDSIRNFYGKDYIELAAGKVWQQRGWKPTLVNSGNRKVRIQNMIDSMAEDISWFDRYMGSVADCGDFITAVGGKVTKNANMQADRLAFEFYDRIESLRLQMEDVFGTTDCTMLFEEISAADYYAEGLTYEEGDVVRTYDNKFYKSLAKHNRAPLTDTNSWEEVEYTNTIKTGNLVSHVNYGEWENARHKFAQQLKRDFNDYLIEKRQKAYEKNKGDATYVFSLTDQQKAILYHEFADPQWKKWHEEHSEEDKSIPGRTRMIPNHIKYHSTQWDNLFDVNNPSLSAEEKAARKRRQIWYNAFMEVKRDMDSLLPANSTLLYRAPQMTGRFSHRYKNLKTIKDTSKAAFGHALRKGFEDFMVVRPDEAYLFGSNNEFNEIEDDPLENPMYFEKEKINRIPLFGINKLKDMSDLSTDLFGTMLQYGSMAATYNAMERVVDVFEFGRDVLKQRKLGNKIESEKASESRAYSRYIKFIEKQIYGVGVTPPSWDRKGMWRKLANNLSSIGGRILLWGNVHGGIVNAGTGVMEILKEAMTGENFNMHDSRVANGMYFSGLAFNIFGNNYGGGFWESAGQGLANTQRPEDKLSLWIRHWNILSENRSFLHNQKYDTKAMSVLDNRLWDWFGHTMMLPYSSGDHYMQTIPYLAMGNHMKVYDHDGNAMTLIDAYEIVDGEEVFAVDDPEHKGEAIGRNHKKLQLKKGIFRSISDIDKYDTLQGMLDRIERFYQNNANLKGTDAVALDLFSDAEREYLADEEFSIPQTVKQLETLNNALRLKRESLLFNQDDESAFMDKCRNICNRLHGIYNAEDKVAFQQNFYGNLVMAMRGYALGMINRRYAGSRFNVPQNRVVEGNYNTAFKVLASMFSKVNTMDNWKAVGEAFLLTIPGLNVYLLSNESYGNRLKADMIKAGFSEHQYYNMRRTGADFLVIQALMLMKFLSSPGRHFGLSDEEDEDKVKSNDNSDNLVAGIIYYFVNRWDREQEAFNTPRGMWNEATSLLDYIPVGFSGAKAIWDIAELFAKTEIDQMGEPDLENSDLYYQSSKEGKYKTGDEKWKVRFMRLCPYIRSWYTFTHPYDAAAGFEYGRRIRGK